MEKLQTLFSRNKMHVLRNPPPPIFGPRLFSNECKLRILYMDLDKTVNFNIFFPLKTSTALLILHLLYALHFALG